jgi:DNA-binding GntR family transcriptional regulator
VSAVEEHPRSLSETAYQVLRDRILACDLVPGERLTERSVAAELGLGLTPVRQALTRLDSEGLVRTVPRRGYQVKPLTLKSVTDLFQVWRIIGPAIAELASRNATDEDRAWVTEHKKAMRTSWQNSDWPALMDGAQELWLMMARTTGNERLQDLYQGLDSELRRVFSLVFRSAPALESLERLYDGALFTEPINDSDFCERFIDVARRQVLGVVTTWPSVTQVEVLPPAS